MNFFKKVAAITASVLVTQTLGLLINNKTFPIQAASSIEPPSIVNENRSTTQETEPLF